ncbi:MAG: ABC transporter substrate-binding protein, partial [Chloroflexota bacterium]
ERIAAMDRFTYETLLAVGIEPMAGTNFALGISNNLPYLASQVNSATDIGGTTSINFELLLTLEPDLIFTLEGYDATSELSAIAPTISFTFDTSSQWREIAEATALAVNAEEALEDVEGGYEERLEALQAVLDVPDTFEIAVVRPAEEGLSLPVQNLFLNTILDNAGLQLPEAWDEVTLDTAYADITLERLDLVDADVMLIWWFSAEPESDEESAAYVSELEENPLWQTLEVVQNNEVYLVGSYWIGSSYHAAHAVIDDLFRYVAGVGPQEIAPNPFLMGEETDMETTEEASSACEDGFRPFVDVTGEPVCVPEVPERIVAIHDINAGAQVLSLGGPLVGMASREDGFRADVARYFDLEGIVDVGSVYEPNLERILELQPDLIVHEGFDGQLFLVDDEMLATLQAIAPVVAIDAFRPVEEVMADYQELLGEAATIALEDQQETFNDLLTDIEDILGDDWQNVTASFVDIANDGNLQIWGPTALVPLDILTRIGVTWVSIQQEAGSEENGGYIGGFSLERIDELNADLTLVDVRFTPGTVDNPLYRQLTAVQAGQVIILNEPFSGTHYPNYIATAELLLDGLTALDDIDTDLVDEPEAEAAAGCDAGFNSVADATGATVCLPEDSQRIVALSEVDIDSLLALGITPTAVTDGRGQATPPGFPTEFLPADVISTGTFFQPNLEVILEADPDPVRRIHRPGCAGTA